MFDMFLNKSSYDLRLFCADPMSGKIFCRRDLAQNVLSQSNYRMTSSAISLELHDGWFYFLHSDRKTNSAIVITGLKETESIRLQDSFISSIHWIKWKNTLIFLRIERYLRKARTKTVLAWLLEKSDCRILCSVISPESSAGSIWFFPWRQNPGKEREGLKLRFFLGLHGCICHSSS